MRPRLVPFKWCYGSGGSDARIVSVTNSSEGKVVKVKGHCYRNNQPVIEVFSSFLYRGRFVD
jgi:fatty acid synthase subunit alpha